MNSFISASVLPLRLQITPVTVEVKVCLIQPVRKQLNAVKLRPFIGLRPQAQS